MSTEATLYNCNAAEGMLEGVSVRARAARVPATETRRAPFFAREYVRIGTDSASVDQSRTIRSKKLHQRGTQRKI